VASLDSSGKVPAAQIPGGGGGSTAWGSITGTLSAQTDLQSALSALQPAISGNTCSGSQFANQITTAGALVCSAIPTLNQNTTGTAANITATSNSTLTTLSALSLPYSQLSGTVPTWNQNTTGTAANITATSNSTLTSLPGVLGLTPSQLAAQAADTFLANGTGGSAIPTAISAATAASILPAFIGDSGSGGTQGSVPAPAAYSAQSGNFLGAGGSFSYVDQSKTINPSFSLISQTAASPSGVKFESTKIFTSTTTGKKYAIGVGFVSNPLTIWDISDQTSPVLVGTIVEAGGGAYNVTVGVVSGVQYAFVGYNSGSKLAVFNLTNPAVPTLTSTTVITGSPGSIYGVAFLNGYVYCATQSTGLVVMDVGGGTGTPALPVQTFQQAGGAKSFGVVAVGTNVYTTMFSTSSPYTVRQLVSWTLTSAGSPSVPSQLQSLQVTAAGEALGLSVNGNTAFVTTAASGAYNINLVDITTPSSMTNLSQINSSNTFGSGFYAVGSGNYVYVPSGGNVTYGGAIDVYDISTRTSPIHIAQATSGIASDGFGGIALSGGYIFVADYGISAGTSPFFDVFTAMNETTVIGAATVSSLTITGSVTGLPGVASTTSTVSANTTVPTLTKNYILGVNSTSSAIAITLPDAVASAGFCVMGKNIGFPANNVTYGTTSAQTIDTQSTFVQNTANDANTFCAINGNWSLY
jgi:hypothetical protein